MCTSNNPNDGNIISEIKQRNDALADEDDSLPSKEESETSEPSVSEVKAAANIQNNFFLTENVNGKIWNPSLLPIKKKDW
ncbi:hypothetical protein NPIL_595301 [Nephila pilipes]|uniref:Uncharacterized protein n=1 Tax=Nephila pilipes TaxID=299642 RepID=A0A8X6N0T7_NEPPI|nr:hypothetical protein NPIL_595301 [Nephila pilipes]